MTEQIHPGYRDPLDEADICPEPPPSFDELSDDEVRGIVAGDDAMASVLASRALARRRNAIGEQETLFPPMFAQPRAR